MMSSTITTAAAAISIHKAMFDGSPVGVYIISHLLIDETFPIDLILSQNEHPFNSLSGWPAPGDFCSGLCYTDENDYREVTDGTKQTLLVRKREEIQKMS